MEAMSAAAKWHREQAARLAGRAERATIHRARPLGESEHHATAADALEALAVITDLLAAIENGRVVMLYHDGEALTFTAEESTALATLAKIARGE